MYIIETNLGVVRETKMQRRSLVYAMVKGEFYTMNFNLT